MIRYILLTIFLCLLTCGAKAQVVIEDPVAKFFLEQNEKVKALTEEKTIIRAEISNLNTQIDIEKKKTVVAEDQVLILKNKVAEFQKRLDWVDGEKKQLEKEIRKLKLKNTITYIVAGLVIVITLSIHG